MAPGMRVLQFVHSLCADPFHDAQVSIAECRWPEPWPQCRHASQSYALRLGHVLREIRVFFQKLISASATSGSGRNEIIHRSRWKDGDSGVLYDDGFMWLEIESHKAIIIQNQGKFPPSASSLLAEHVSPAPIRGILPEVKSSLE